MSLQSARFGNVLARDFVIHDQLAPVARGSIRSDAVDTTLAALLRKYDGESIDVSFRQLVGALPADELTHSIYPYPARLLRQIPRFLLRSSTLTEGVSTIVDPFCGSGTVLVEAQTAGFRALGMDQNPIASLVARVKTAPLSAETAITASNALVARAKLSRRYAEAPKFATRWYDDSSISVLGRLVASLEHWQDDPVVHDFLSVSIALLSRAAAHTDKRIPVPVRPREHAQAWSSSDLWKAFLAIAHKCAFRVGRLPAAAPRAEIRTVDARLPSSWMGFGRGEQLILCSPPYGAAQKYVRSTSLELAWLGHCETNGTSSIERSSIGREHLSKLEIDSFKLDGDRLPAVDAQLRRIAKQDSRRAAIYGSYFDDMAATFERAAESKTSSRMILVTGANYVCGEVLDTPHLLTQLAEHAGFQRTLSLRDTIRGRSLLTTRRNASPVATSEVVDVFERSPDEEQ